MYDRNFRSNVLARYILCIQIPATALFVIHILEDLNTVVVPDLMPLATSISHGVAGCIYTPPNPDPSTQPSITHMVPLIK